MARWESMWAGGLEPGDAFDAAEPLPMLCKLVSAGTLGRRGKRGERRRRALVPGCGRGYAATELAKVCDEALGIDIAPTAVRAAEARLRALQAASGDDGGGGGAGGEAAAQAASVSFREADFFSEADLGGAFDVVYDYTFLCAIPPGRRADWAARMAALLVPGTGQLVTVIFPICGKSGGPPFAMSEQLVGDLLLPLGFTLQQPLRSLAPDEAHAGRAGSGGPATSLGIWLAPPAS